MVSGDLRLRRDIDALTPYDTALMLRLRPELGDCIVGSEDLEDRRISEEAGIGFTRQTLDLSRPQKADVFAIGRRVFLDRTVPILEVLRVAAHIKSLLQYLSHDR